MHTHDNGHQTRDLTSMIGHVNTHSRLWKFATFRFVCRGLLVWALVGGHRSRRTGSLCSQGPNSQMAFRGRVLKTFGVRLQLVDFLLIGWWRGNKVISQESQSSAFWFQIVWGLCADVQHVVIILHLGRGVLAPIEHSTICVWLWHIIPWGGTRTLLYCWLLLKLSLIFLIFIYLGALGLNCSTWDLCSLLQCVNSQLQHVGSSFLVRDWIWAPALGAWSLSHCTTREVPIFLS